jgi:hypothetical protein
MQAEKSQGGRQLEATLLRAVEGPKGKAEIFEVQEEGTTRVIYEVRFNGKTEKCLAMGEAYITAGELSGTPL